MFVVGGGGVGGEDGDGDGGLTSRVKADVVTEDGRVGGVGGNRVCDPLRKQDGGQGHCCHCCDGGCSSACLFLTGGMEGDQSTRDETHRL